MPSPAPQNQTLSARCCVVGGGPAGVMLGFLLARAGIETIILEKHPDFFRDFRGDTIHPSTLEVIGELGLLEEFLKRPHQQARSLAAWFGDDRIAIADFAHLATRCKFVAFMPQWDFLDFLAENAKAWPDFRLMMGVAATDLIIEADRVVGVRAQGPGGPLEIRADLVVAADGRHSTLRDKAGFAPVDIGAPMDVLWMKIARSPDDPDEFFGRFVAGRILIMINRETYWQCGFVIRKGGYEEVRRRGLPALRAEIAALAPFFAGRVDSLIDSFEEVKLLTVAVNRLERWARPGFLCIGDAAHAMSPVGGVGINLAVQDAVAAANLLAAPLLRGAPTLDELEAVQKRRDWPTKATQSLQVLVQNKIIGGLLGDAGAAGSAPPLKPPLPLRLLRDWPFLRRFPGRFIGLGVRPEHLRVGPAAAAGDARR